VAVHHSTGKEQKTVSSAGGSAVFPGQTGLAPPIIGMEPAENAPMKSTSSTIHYQAAPTQQVSKRTAAILIASVLAIAGVLIAIVR
jgi:hypothetical protein